MSVETESQIHKLTEGSFLFSSDQGNILFGCPPEILKRILVAHLPMPDTVVVPESLHHFHSSQASLEFPLYHFLFVQRGLECKRQFQVVALPRQCEGLEKLLRVTVVGPNEGEMVASGMEPSLAKEIYQETYHLCLKHPDHGRAYEIKEIVNFIPLETGKRHKIYPVRGKLPEVLLERTGGATYRLLYGEDSFELDLTVTQPQEPNYEINHVPLERTKGAFNLTVMGRSNGFDPNDPANGYVLNMSGRIVIWDCPAYLNLHLERMGLDYHEVEAMILSHVHEDHIDVVESLRDPPVPLYATPEVYYSLLVKLSAMYDCSLKEAQKYHDWKKIEPWKRISICGGSWEFFHAVHAIPAVGARITFKSDQKKGLIHISGDHLSHATLDSMLSKNGISKRRYDEVRGLVRGNESLVLMDAGGGAIHGDYREYLDYEGARMAFMHTGLIQESLPDKMELITSGQVIKIF